MHGFPSHFHRTYPTRRHINRIRQSDGELQIPLQDKTTDSQGQGTSALQKRGTRGHDGRLGSRAAAVDDRLAIRTEEIEAAVDLTTGLPASILVSRVAAKSSLAISRASGGAGCSSLGRLSRAVDDRLAIRTKEIEAAVDLLTGLPASILVSRVAAKSSLAISRAGGGALCGHNAGADKSCNQ